MHLVLCYENTCIIEISMEKNPCSAISLKLLFSYQNIFLIWILNLDVI